MPWGCLFPLRLQAVRACLQVPLEGGVAQCWLPATCLLTPYRKMEKDYSNEWAVFRWAQAVCEPALFTPGRR